MRGTSNVKSPFCALLSFLNQKGKTPKRRTLRGFEPLEDRLALSVATPSITSLPDEVTIYAGSSFHYTTEGDTNFDVVNVGDLGGMEATQLSGRTVSITYDVTDAETNTTSTLGTVVIQLFDDDAPKSSERFYRLADSTDQDFYEGKEVTRIAAVYSIIQAGSPNGDLSGGSNLTPALEAERAWKLSQNSAGMVMFCGSASGPGDQFYIAWDSCAEFDYDYNVLGFVVSGYDTIEKLTELETTARSMGSGTEQSDPVDKVVMKDVTVSGDAVTSNVFRLSAAAGTSGTTQVVFNVTDAKGAVVQKTVTVNVVDLAAAETGDKIELEMNAGETLRVNLPTKYGDLEGTGHAYRAAAYKSDATASTVDNALPEGVTLKNDTYGTYFELAAEAASSGVFEIALTVYDKGSSGNTSVAKTLYYDVYVRPAAPTVEFSEEYLLGSSATTTASTTLQYVISNIAADDNADLYISITKDDGTKHEYQLRGGQTDYSAYYTRKTVEGAYEYTLTLTQADLRNATWGILGETDSVDGAYRLAAWQQLDVEYNEHELLVSDSAECLINILSTGLDFNMDKTTFTLADFSIGEAMTPVELAVKTNSDEITVASVAFAQDAVVPGNMAITRGDDGVYRLGWTPVASDSGHEYHVAVVATDSVGRQTAKTLVFKVSSGPSFDVLDADGTSVVGKTVSIDEATSVSFTVDLTKDPDYTSEQEYAGSYSLYKITTVDGTESEELVDSGSLSFTNGVASGTRTFTEAEGPGTFRAEFLISLASSPEATTKAAVKIQVAEINAGPTITFKQDEPFSVEVGSTETWQLTATDSDVPVQSLQWSFDGTVPECLTLAADGTLKLAPTQDDSDTTFTVKVVVSDGLLTDSIDLSFVVPLWVDPGDNAEVTVPEPLPTLTTPEDCTTAWGNVNEYRLEQIQASKDRFLAAFTQAGETFKETVSTLASQLQAGDITRDEYRQQAQEAAIVKEQEQAKNALNLETRNAKINQCAQEQYDTIATTGSTLGVDLSAEDAIDESQPLRLTYAEMQQIWQASLPCFSALSASAVDAVLASYLS